MIQTKISPQAEGHHFLSKNIAYLKKAIEN